MFAKLIAPVILVASFTQFAFAQTEFTATLSGHAVLPSQTFIDPPADAPEDLKNFRQIHRWPNSQRKNWIF